MIRSSDLNGHIRGMKYVPAPLLESCINPQGESRKLFAIWGLEAAYCSQVIEFFKP